MKHVLPSPVPNCLILCLPSQQEMLWRTKAAGLQCDHGVTKTIQRLNFDCSTCSTAITMCLSCGGRHRQGKWCHNTEAPTREHDTHQKSPA